MISRTAVPRSAIRDAMLSRIWRWTMTSSALVGSSAMTSFGLAASAAAIRTRWRIPPRTGAIMTGPRGGVVDPAFLERPHGGLAGGPLPLEPVDGERFGRLVARALQRFHAAVGPRDQADLPAPHVFPLLAGQPAEIGAVERRRAGIARALPGRRLMMTWAMIVFPDPDSPTIATTSPG